MVKTSGWVSSALANPSTTKGTKAHEVNPRYEKPSCSLVSLVVDDSAIAKLSAPRGVQMG